VPQKKKKKQKQQQKKRVHIALKQSNTEKPSHYKVKEN
jgi:hypothetical protein